MALTATITKFSVEELYGASDFRATIKVVVQNEVAEVLLERNYSERHNSSTSIDTIKAKLKQKFVDDWNKYKGEKTILDATAFDNLVADLQTEANTYINQ